MFGIAIYSWAGNNFSKLTTPYDAEGKGCGVDYPDYPYIYFVSPEYDVSFYSIVESLENSLREKLSCRNRD